MIIREKSNWFSMLFVWKGSVLPVILPRLLVLLVLSIGVVWSNGQLYHFKIALNPAPFTLIGLALALFLGFRNSASYDRFWEGRKLWGALVIDTRSLARQAATISGYSESSAEVKEFVHLLIAFSYAMKHQLRNTDPAEDLQRLLPPQLAEAVYAGRFRPVLLLKEIGRWINRAREEGRIDPIILTAFDRNIDNLSGILGGCERIANTPIPFAYNVLLHRTVYIYCLLLPFGLVDNIGWMTPVIAVFIGYTFIALDAIITEIEEPFGVEPNDLALNAICRTIEASLQETIGLEAVSLPESNLPDYRVD